MRYIGCKESLLPFIESVLIDNGVKGGVFADLFSGTTSVAKHFKRKGFSIISTDLMHFSYTFQKTYIAVNEVPQFSRLLKGDRGKEILSSSRTVARTLFGTPGEIVVGYLNTLKGVKGFFYEHYCAEGSQNKTYQRSYFSESNAKRIDAIRSKIQEWFSNDLISDNEHSFLVTALLEAIPSVSNIAGTYGTFLKYYDVRALKPITLGSPEIITSSKQHSVFNRDANSLIGDIEADVIYLDPPYNTRQYAPYYHVLETASRWDNPAIYGKTGRRPYSNEMSDYCRRNRVANALEELVINAHCKHFLLSYGSEGLLSDNQIRGLLSALGHPKVYRQDYRRYKSNGYKSTSNHGRVNENLYYVKAS